MVSSELVLFVGAMLAVTTVQSCVVCAAIARASARTGKTAAAAAAREAAIVKRLDELERFVREKLVVALANTAQELREVREALRPGNSHPDLTIR